MLQIKIYTTSWCPDCRAAKNFLRERNVPFEEIDIEEHDEAEEVVIRANEGKRRVPTFEVDGRYFACSPFDPALLSEELDVPLNP